MGKTRGKSRGICNRCGHPRTLVSLTRGHCKPCGYTKDNCVRCRAYRKIYVRGYCYLCYQDERVGLHLRQVESEFVKPASQYNQDLFALYMTYLRRYRMSYDHLRPTKSLIQYLEQHPITPIRCWNDIYSLSHLLPLTRAPEKAVHDNGCVWMKIGYMLQELGVLGVKGDEFQHRLAAQLEHFDSQTTAHVRQFSVRLKKSGRADASVNRAIGALQALSDWLSHLAPPETLLLAHSMSIECYFEFMQKTHSYETVVVAFRRLAAFYRWAKQTKLTLLDPTENIRISRAAQKLVITSKTQFEQLRTFLRDPDCSAPQAMALTLILFFGFTTADLAGATIDLGATTDGPLRIILTRKPRSRGRRYYNREQVLTLPSDPPWLKRLVRRFRTHWQDAYAKVKPKISFPKTPLFLDPQFQHNRNLSDEYIRALIKKATLHATGSSITPRVLRQTCGHIMTRGDDASALSHLGWSPQFAFHYTWLPRIQRPDA